MTSTYPLPVQASPGLSSWLQEQGIALSFTTYRANRLLFLGTSPASAEAANGTEPSLRGPGLSPQLRLHERLFDRPMGLFVDGECLWMAARCQIWRLDNFLTAGEIHEGGDRLYVPAASFTTGDVNAHELALDTDGRLIFVNTAFSCLATLEPGCSFAPTWTPPFIPRLAGDDRCHLNGLALRDGIPTWATTCGSSGDPSSWRNHRNDGGVLIHIPTGELAATGLAMPHSPRWYGGKVWLLNSGTGELGWIEKGQFQPLCRLPGFVRGLAFAGGCAVVGLSKLRSPQFTGLPLEKRLIGEGNPWGCCGLRVIDLASGEVRHTLELPDPIDELFDVVVLPGVRQPRALGLQGEEIDCLVKLPDQPKLVHVRPLAPSGKTHDGPAVGPYGQPKPSRGDSAPFGPHLDPVTPNEQSTPATGPAADTRIHYQRVFHLTPANLTPYASLTFPPLIPGSSALERIDGELLGLSAMAEGVMVGLAIAKRNPEGGAQLISLKVNPLWRRRGIGTGLLQRLMVFLAREDIWPLTLRYRASPAISAELEPILARLGWSPPITDVLLLEGRSEQLAAIDWADRHPLRPPYRLLRWQELTHEQRSQLSMLEAPAELLAPAEIEGLEPEICLALLHHQELVGWLLAHRSRASSVRYSSL
ncbi:MAG: TIGR03032 family protein, partial [Cyanobacteriota bacterium]